MESTVMLKINPCDAVPTDGRGRVAWLERYGVLTGSAAVEITAPLATWADAGAEISPTGEVQIGRGDLEYHLRTALLSMIQSSGQIPSVAGPEILQSYVDARATALADIRARRLTERESNIAICLGWPDQSWILRSSNDEPTGELRRVLGDVEDDPRVSARIAHVRDMVLPAAKTAWAEARAEVDAKRSACETALRVLASNEDSLARAAAENYPISTKTLDAIASAFALRASGKDDRIRIDDRAWYQPEERAAPNAQAFELLDRVRAAAKSSTLPAAIGTWMVSRILRIDVCPHAGETHNVTAVLATLDTACGLRQITFSTESQECTHCEAD